MTTPGLSVVLVTDRYETIAPVVVRLRAQTVRHRLELVLVAPATPLPGADPVALEGFAAIQMIEVESILPLGEARAVGVRAARAPIVVIGETHSYPHPGWAETLMRAHAGSWAVVVPAFGNANPDGALSWAAFLRDYGLWVEGLPAKETDVVPPYNTAAKREVLLGFGARLAHVVSQGDALAQGLRAQGLRNYFEPAARIDHANVSRPLAWVVQRFLAGRAFAGSRSTNWPVSRRLLYVFGSPLIPAVILWRLAHSVREVRRHHRLPAGTIPALVVAAVVTALGEMITYAAGIGSGTVFRADEYELYKLRYTSLGSP